MKDVTVSKHRRNGQHVGFRKFVYGRNFHLVTGTSPEKRLVAESIASALVAQGEKLRISNGNWTQEIIRDCFKAGEIDGAPDPMRHSGWEQSAIRAEPTMASPEPGGTLYVAMEAYKAAERERSRTISHCHSVNNIYRIEWSKEGITDRNFSEVTLHDLKGWTSHFTSRPVSAATGKPISAYTAAGIVRVIGHFLDYCDAEGFWIPCHRWKDALKGAHPKKLMSHLERNRRKREGFINLTVEEAQILWQMATPDARVLFGLGLWTGCTQNEIATTLLDGEFTDRGSDLYLIRDRHKTRNYGKWWIPPELATLIRQRLQRTPRDPRKNPGQLAFLTRDGLPLVHFGANNYKARSDAVEQVWSTMLRAAKHYGVRHVSFKYLRKTMAQCVRNHLGIEYATLFSAQ